jgi:serine/threonine protein kinase/tetratricopeptide (TPR) repeat protein
VRNESEANAADRKRVSGEPGSDADLESLVGRIADEFAARYARGERPTVEEYLLRYPETAATLREVLATAEAMCSMSKTSALSGPQATAIVPPTLGDFQIIREVARGGMGTVYEARQVSLNRRVALKVLPFTALLDERQLQRFQNEAQAAACLHHTHIVPVHAVGRDGNMHFYAMQYIDGQSLAQVLASLRNARGAAPVTASQPAPSSATTAPVAGAAALTDGAIDSPAWIRQVARWGIDAAEALDYAHTQGIVHRDIKPGNLLIDGAGEIWITDFGLARRAGEANLTKTGDMVGTLRYMSPEQVQSQRPLIDHRSDIYALGATLYELLTLQALFTGSDPGFLIRQITRDEPRSPAQMNKSVPKDLETIVLKAIEKDVGSRYATAKALADDLRRFLDQKPITARRATTSERLIKWSRRNAAAVTTALAVCIICSVVLAGSTIWVSRAKAAADANATAAGNALVAQKKAEGNLRNEAQAALAARNEAQQRAQESERETAKARVSFGRMMDAVGRFQGLMAKRSLPENKAAYARAIREVVIREYDDFLKECAADPGFEPECGMVHARLSEMTDSGDDRTTAKTHCDEAIRILEPLVRDAQIGRHERAELARSYRMRARFLAEESTGQSLTRARSPLPVAPTDQERSRGFNDLDARAQCDYKRAIVLYRALDEEFPEEYDYAYWEGRILSELGRHYSACGQPQRAAEFSLQGDTVLASKFKNWNRETRDWSFYRHPNEWVLFHAQIKIQAAYHLTEAGDLERAERVLREAIAEVKHLGPEWQIGYPDFSPAVAMLEGALSYVLSRLGRNDEEALCFYRIIDECDAIERLLRASSDARSHGRSSPEFAGMTLDSAADNLSSAYQMLAAELAHRGEIPIAETLLQKVFALREQFCSSPSLPSFANYQSNLSSTYLDWGDLLSARVRFGDSRVAEEVVSAYRRAIQLRPDDVRSYENLSVFYQMSGQNDSASDLLRGLVERMPKNAAIRLLLGNALIRSGATAEATAELERALEQAPPHSSICGTIILAFASIGEFDRECVSVAIRRAEEIHPGTERYPALGNALLAQGSVDAAVAFGRMGVAYHPNSAAVRDFLATALSRQKNWSSAIAELQTAKRLDPKYVPAYSTLAAVLTELGRFDEAADELRDAHDLSVQAHDARGPKQEQVEQARHRAELDRKFVDVVSGRIALGSPQEAFEFAMFCDSVKRAYVAASRFYAKAFAGEPSFPADSRSGNRLRAACAAIRAGTGQGIDATVAADSERAQFRARALEWLSADIADIRRIAEQNPSIRSAAAQALVSLKQNVNLALTGDQSQAPQLPGRESDSFARLWAEQADALTVFPGTPEWSDRFEKVLPDILSDQMQLATGQENLDYAEFCLTRKRLYPLAAKLYARAFSLDRALCDDVRSRHRYNAACAAALAAKAAGRDDLSDSERAKWRAQALTWLQADLSEMKKVARGAWSEVGADAAKVRAQLARMFSHWLHDPDLAGIRDPERLDALPEAERAACEVLWRDVNALLAKLNESAPAAEENGAPNKSEAQ